MSRDFKFTTLSLEEYSSFQKKHPYHSFLNSKEAVQLREMNHQSFELLGVKENDELVGATICVYLPVMKKFFYAYAQNGLLVDYFDQELLSFFVDSIKKHIKKRNCIYFIMDPYVPERERDEGGSINERGFNNTSIISSLKNLGFLHQGFPTDYSNMAVVNWMFVKELQDESEDELLKQLDQQTRWSIRKTLKQGVQVRELTRDELSIFIAMERDTAKRRGFSMREEYFYYNQYDSYKDHANVILAYINLDDFLSHLSNEKEDLLKQLEEVNHKLESTPNNSKQLNKKKAIEEALEVNHKNETHSKELKETYGSILNLSTAFFLEYEDEYIYLYSASDETFKEYFGPYAIQWYMLRKALKNHIPLYNFYGISGNFKKEAEDYGVYLFKKGFGGKVILLLGDFILPLSPIYALYKRLKRIRGSL